MTKDERGVMYYGNSEGVLVFDGEHWQLYQMPQNIIVRSVAADGKGKVFAGGFAEFGYWSYNQEGRFVYSSLTSLLPDRASLREEIWKIYVDGKRVIFQSFAAIYIYENGKIRTIRGPDSYLFLLKAGKRFFIQVISKGLYELKGDSLHFVPGSEVLADARVLSVLPFKNKAFLVGTAQNGMYRYDESGVTPWDTEANDFLKKQQLNNGALVQGKYYAYGTILNGVIVLDQSGRIVQQVNKTKGLQNNTVLSLYADSEQNLWAGLDNGIDRIEINSPLFYYFDRAGKFGTVYASIIHDGRIYLGTNQGLFYSEWSAERPLSLQSFDFKMIERTQGQVWDLSLFDGQLFCGHNDGTFLVKGTGIQKISQASGGWVLKQVRARPDLLIQGTYNGLVVYQKDAAGNWAMAYKVAGFEEPSRYVDEDNAGNIWVSHDYRGVFKLSLSDDFRSVKAVRRYGRAEGLPGSIHIYGFKLENRMVFSSGSGFFIYDDIADRFLRYKELNQKLGLWASSDKIIKATGKKYWFIEQGKVALVDLSQSGKVLVDTAPFKKLSGHMVKYYENISRISNAMYLISIDDGFVVYKENLPSQATASIPSVIIRKVQNTTDGLVTLRENGTTTPALEIPFNQNNIRISWALPYYDQVRPVYQYYLEDYSNNWSDWSNGIQKEFANLPPGKYRFLVRAKVGDLGISPVSAFSFTILPPWYAHPWALLAYALLVIALLFLLRQLYQRRLRRDQESIQQQLEQEKAEFLQQEALAHEQRMVKLKNEQLQAELASKSRELANSALNIISKNELLQSLREEIQQLQDATGKKLPEGDLHKIQKIISEGMSSEQDWHLLESSFNETHENYFKNLKSLYPELTPNDLKFCAYLRMNMSSKEIASLLNITLRAVEIRRYRLRKKLNLGHEKNLVEFLMGL